MVGRIFWDDAVSQLQTDEDPPLKNIPEILKNLNTRELIRHFHSTGFCARTACVDPKVLDASFAGRELDEQFFRDLPANVDPCGENGEFHTFVFDGPVFRNPIRVRVGEIVERDSFIYCDLLPSAAVVARTSAGPHKHTNLKGETK